MFEAVEQRLLPGSPEAMGAAVPGAVYQAAMVQATPTMPGYWQGKGTQSSWGLLPVVAVRLAPGQGGTMAEVRVGAELDSTSLVLFIAACIVFWPAAAVLAYLAYDDFQKRRTGILHAIWQRLGAPAGGYAPGPHGGPPPVGPYGLPGPHGGGAPGGGYGGAPGG